MKRTMWYLLTMLTPMLLVAACSRNPVEPNLNGQQEEIQQLIEANTEIFGLEGFNDDGAQSPSYDTDLPKTAEFIEPLLFGRRGRPHLQGVEVEFVDDNTAIATVTQTFDGDFFILAKDPNNENAFATLYKKEMQNVIVRKAMFAKVADAGSDRRQWKLTQVSLREGESPSTTLSLESVRIDLPGTGEDLVVTDPLAYFFDLSEGVPTFSPGDTVKIFVTLSNLNEFPPEPGETVLLRYKMDHRILRARRQLNDEGEYPDASADDGIYSGYWVIGYRQGIFHAAVDVLDNGTLYDDVAPYNSVFWSMPYRVQR